MTVDLMEEMIKPDLASVNSIFGMKCFRVYMWTAELMRELVPGEGFRVYLSLTVYPRILERSSIRSRESGTFVGQDQSYSM